MVGDGGGYEEFWLQFCIFTNSYNRTVDERSFHHIMFWQVFKVRVLGIEDRRLVICLLYLFLIRRRYVLPTMRAVYRYSDMYLMSTCKENGAQLEIHTGICRLKPLELSKRESIIFNCKKF